MSKKTKDDDKIHNANDIIDDFGNVIPNFKLFDDDSDVLLSE